MDRLSRRSFLRYLGLGILSPLLAPLVANSAKKVRPVLVDAVSLTREGSIKNLKLSYSLKEVGSGWEQHIYYSSDYGKTWVEGSSGGKGRFWKVLANNWFREQLWKVEL